MNGDSHSVEQWKSDLTAAGWAAVSSTAWRAPDGSLWRGPYGAWKELQRRQASPHEQIARRIVGFVFDNTGASHETLKRVMIERITDYLAAATTDTAAQCVHCGHDKYWSMTGTCGMNTGARATIPRPCGCKCEFVEGVATSPRCSKCGYVMCQQFDSRPVNAVAEIAIPNGEYICYRCEDAEPVTTAAARAATEIDEYYDALVGFNIRVMGAEEVAAIISKHFPTAGVEAGGDEC